MNPHELERTFLDFFMSFNGDPFFILDCIGDGSTIVRLRPNPKRNDNMNWDAFIDLHGRGIPRDRRLRIEVVSPYLGFTDEPLMDELLHRIIGETFELIKQDTSYLRGLEFLTGDWSRQDSLILVFEDAEVFDERRFRETLTAITDRVLELNRLWNEIWMHQERYERKIDDGRKTIVARLARSVHTKVNGKTHASSDPPIA